MFFVASKLFWGLAAPSNLLVLGALLGLGLAFWRRRTGMALAAVSLLGLLAGGLSPLPILLARPLEDRFPAPGPDTPVAGVIVLGGAVEARESMLRGQILVNHAGERMIALADLARRYPEARLVFSGGPPNEAGGLNSEATAIERFSGTLGLPARILYEGRSRNTRENAAFTAALVPPRAGERWLLVTSAFHMPRAMGCFRAVGYEVVAYPVDYRTVPGELDPFRTSADGLTLLDLAAKEWVGLLAYRIAGYVDALWPGP